MLTEHEQQIVIRGLKKKLFPGTSGLEPLMDCLVNDLNVPVQMIAEHLGVKQPTVSQWLYKKRPIPERQLPLLKSLMKDVVALGQALLKDYEDGKLIYSDEFWMPGNHEIGELGKLLIRAEFWSNPDRMLKSLSEKK